MPLLSLESQVKLQAYWDAFRTGGLQFALFPDRRSPGSIQSDLQKATSEGDIARASSDIIHLLRRESISIQDATNSMVQVHAQAITRYQHARDSEEQRHITGPIAFVRREAREARLEVAQDQVTRREIRWRRLATRSLKTAPLRTH